MNPIWLEAGAYTLRPPEPPDVAWIYDACQDDDIARWNRIPQPYTGADAVAFLERTRLGWERGIEFVFLVGVTETGELLGSCGANRRDGEVFLEIGYWLAREGRGRGVMTTAVERLVRWVQHGVRAPGVFADVIEGNDRSEALLRRLSFSKVSDPIQCEQRSVMRPASRWELRFES